MRWAPPTAGRAALTLAAGLHQFAKVMPDSVIPAVRSQPREPGSPLPLAGAIML